MKKVSHPFGKLRAGFGAKARRRGLGVPKRGMWRGMQNAK
jgi:hypothetical protein